MGKSKQISESDLIGSESTELVPPKTTQKETTTMNTPFYKKTTTIIIATVVITLLAVFGTYKLYEFVFNKGVQFEKDRQHTIALEIARSKQAQQ